MGFGFYRCNCYVFSIGLFVPFHTGNRFNQFRVSIIPFAAFVIVSFANAFNIADGLDGLASGLLLICLVAF